MEVLESKRKITCAAGGRRQSQTSTHMVRDGLGPTCVGQGKEERTCLEDRLAAVPPPPAALSSHVLHRDGEEGCVSVGATSTVSRGHHRRPRSRAARPQGGCPGEAASLHQRTALFREPKLEHGQHGSLLRPRRPRHERCTGSGAPKGSEPLSNGGQRHQPSSTRAHIS